MRRIWLSLLAIAVVSLIGLADAKGSYPGRNGRIAFDVRKCEGPRIASIRPDGTGLRYLGLREQCSEDVPWQRHPSWSADGTRLLAERSRGLALVSADGSLISQLPFSKVSDPTLSPDGQRVAFTRTRPGDDHPFIWTANLDGSDERPLRYGLSPRWSPDGETIAYVEQTTYGLEPEPPGGLIGPPTQGDSGRASGGEIWLMRASTGEAIRRVGPSVTSDTICCRLEQTESLDWSPDGRKLLYSPYSCCYSSPTNLFVINADGSEAPRKLTTTRRLQESHAVWSPNGRRIAFVLSVYDSTGETFQYSIWTMRPSGGQPTRLWTSRTYESIVGFTPARPYLSWQPRPAPPG